MGTDEELIDQRAMSKILGITTKTAEAWRSRGFGPKFVKIGTLVKYRKADIRLWVESRTVGSTSQKLPQDAA